LSFGLFLGKIVSAPLQMGTALVGMTGQSIGSAAAVNTRTGGERKVANIQKLMKPQTDA